VILLVVIPACAVAALAVALVLVIRAGLIEISHGSTTMTLTLPVSGDRGYTDVDVDLPNLSVTFGGWHLYIVAGRWAR